MSSAVMRARSNALSGSSLFCVLQVVRILLQHLRQPMIHEWRRSSCDIIRRNCD